MIVGILVAVLFILTCLTALGKKVLPKRAYGKLSFAHKVLGILLLLVSVVHMLFTIPLYCQRPILMLILGFALILCALVGCVSYWYRKRIGRRWLSIHKAMALLMLLLLIAHVAIGITSFMQYKKKAAKIQIKEVTVEDLKDGTYMGEYDIGYVSAKVEVIIKQHRISNVILLEHKNERGGSAEVILNHIVAEQKVPVDAISGATNSSKTIMKAVEIALEQAK